MTDQLRDLHNYLQGCCPASGGTIMGDIQLTRKADPKAAALLPMNALELTTAIRGLEIAGLLEKRADNLWYWLNEQPKQEAQRALFA